MGPDALRRTRVIHQPEEKATLYHYKRAFEPTKVSVRPGSEIYLQGTYSAHYETAETTSSELVLPQHVDVHRATDRLCAEHMDINMQAPCHSTRKGWQPHTNVGALGRAAGVDVDEPQALDATSCWLTHNADFVSNALHTIASRSSYGYLL